MPQIEPERSSSSYLQPRALRRCRSASPAPPASPQSNQSHHSSPSHHHNKEIELNGEKKEFLRKSWQKIPKSTFGETVISSLVTKIGPEAFRNDPAVIDRHRRQLIDLVSTCIDNLDDLENALKPWIEELTRGHQGLHIKMRYWEAFGEVLQSCIFEWVGPGKHHKETVKAWMILVSFLSDRLMAAARHAAHHSSPVPSPRPPNIINNYPNNYPPPTNYANNYENNYYT